MWAGYNWLRNDINYSHSTHWQDHDDFGYGLDSTSHIESIQGNLQITKKMLYYSIPNNNSILFLRESEFRRDISGLSNNDKWIEFKNVLNYINDIDIKNLYFIDYLNNFTEK